MSFTPQIIHTYIATYLGLNDHVQRGSGRSGPHANGAEGASEMKERIFGHD
jgi:hypothetical protein